MIPITDEMINAAVEAAWPGEEIIFSEEFDSPEDMMRAALIAALQVQDASSARPQAVPELSRVMIERGRSAASLLAALNAEVSK